MSSGPYRQGNTNMNRTEPPKTSPTAKCERREFARLPRLGTEYGQALETVQSMTSSIIGEMQAYTAGKGLQEGEKQNLDEENEQADVKMACVDQPSEYADHQSPEESPSQNLLQFGFRFLHFLRLLLIPTTSTI